jgi:hypothetical protein
MLQKHVEVEMSVSEQVKGISCKTMVLSDVMQQRATHTTAKLVSADDLIYV